MRTIRSSPYGVLCLGGGCLPDRDSPRTEISLDRNPPWTETSWTKTPRTETSGQRPPGQKPWTETPLDTDLLEGAWGQRQRPPRRNIGPGSQTEQNDWHTSVKKILPCPQTSFAGSNKKKRSEIRNWGTVKPCNYPNLSNLSAEVISTNLNCNIQISVSNLGLSNILSPMEIKTIVDDSGGFLIVIFQGYTSCIKELDINRQRFYCTHGYQVSVPK